MLGEKYLKRAMEILLVLPRVRDILGYRQHLLFPMEIHPQKSCNDITLSRQVVSQDIAGLSMISWIVLILKLFESYSLRQFPISSQP